jgi:hypothetical protein
MSISKRYRSEEEIEQFFNQNSKLKSIAFEKAIAKCIQKELPLSLFNLLLEYEQIIIKLNSKKLPGKD